MLVKLTPEQISNFWDILSYSIDQSLPPIVNEHPNKMNRILTAALCGELDVWASYIRENDKIKFEGVLTTKILFDDVSYTKNLLIYTAFGYTNVDNNTWIEGLETLYNYAKKERCNKIIAYTQVQHIINIVNKLGGDTSYRFVSFDVKDK